MLELIYTMKKNFFGIKHFFYEKRKSPGTKCKHNV